METARKHWIPVTTSAGMFSAECAVSLRLVGGQEVSLFADRNLIREEGGRSFLRVTLVDHDPVQRTDRVLLPTETFETATRWAEVPMERQNMILSNAEIVRCLDEGLFSIDNLAGRDLTQPPFNTSAVDLRLAKEIHVPEEDVPAQIDIRRGGIARYLQQHITMHTITDVQPFTLQPRKMVLGQTLERVSFPLHTTGTCYGNVLRSSQPPRTGQSNHARVVQK